MRSWLVLSSNSGAGQAFGQGVATLVRQTLGVAAIRAQPLDSALADSRGRPVLVFRGDDSAWQRFNDRVPDTQGGLLAFTTTSADDLSRLFVEGPVVFGRGNRFLKASWLGSPDPARYGEFGPYARRFIRFTREPLHIGQTEAVWLTGVEGRFAGHIGRVFWDPIALPGPGHAEDRASWNSWLTDRAFLATEPVALLPPWEPVVERDSYFLHDLLMTRSALRTLANGTSDLQDEPIAMTLWRLADDPAARQILIDGGDLAVPCEGPSMITRIHLRLHRRENDPVSEMLHSVLSRRIEGIQPMFSRVGETVARAIREDLRVAARPASLVFSTVDRPRRWPFPTERGTPLLESPRPDDPFFTTVLPAMRQGLGAGTAPRDVLEERLGGLTTYNRAVGEFVRYFWQPTAAAHDPTLVFWRHSVLVDDGLVENELIGKPRRPELRFRPGVLRSLRSIADRAAGIGRDLGRYVVRLSRIEDRGRLQREQLRVALAMPAGTRIVVGNETLTFDDPSTSLDRSVLA